MEKQTKLNMWRLNVQLDQMDECIRNTAFATKEKFTFRPNDVLLFQISLNSCLDRHERTICYMLFKQYVTDKGKVVDYWGRKFEDYLLVEGSNLEFVRPFSLDDICSTSYSNNKTAMRIVEADIEVVKKRLDMVGGYDDDEIDSNLSAEGKLRYFLHRRYERNPKNTKRIKKQFLKIHKKFFCEICNFEFQKAYGENYIEGN